MSDANSQKHSHMQLNAATAISPRRRLGQHFLASQQIARRIAGALDAPYGSTVFEIGAGTGSLTAALLETRAARVIAVERDLRAAAYLRATLGGDPRLEIVEEDVLRVHLKTFGISPTERTIVAGNIPYNLTGPILFWLFDHADHILRIVLMLQKEVARRLVAAPGSKVYGIPSVATRLVTIHARVLFDVPPGAFVPPPNVVSSVVVLDCNGRSLAEQEHREVMALVHAAFNQRRKKLRNALERYAREYCGQQCREFLSLPLLERRAEELAPCDFRALAAEIRRLRGERT